MNPHELTGRVRTHVVQNDELRFAMTPRATEAFLALRAEAATHGFDLGAMSSFRDFAAQTRIWNKKFRGEATLFDPAGNVLHRDDLSDEATVDVILSWSAVPGASRHHWGTDVDVFDAARVASRSDVQLLPAEFAPGGVFGELDAWLTAEMGRFGFFRPYDVFRGGFNAEPWHLSFAEESVPALLELGLPTIRQALLEEEEIDALDLVLERLATIHERFVLNVNHHMDTRSASGKYS